MVTRSMAIACALLVGTSAAQAETVFGVTLDQTLISWDSATPGTLTSGSPISGMLANEVIRGIDFRPATGQLMAMGSFSRVYTINPTNGAATLVSTLSTNLSGSSFGVDFNPTVDRMRVVSDTDQNLRINVGTGAVTTDLTLAFAAGDANFGVNPNITGAAYTNNFAGATTTTLYVVDTALDILAIQSPPNNGTLNTVGAVGTDLTDLAGFDISGATGIAYMGVRDSLLSKSTFWQINLATGAGSFVGDVGGGAILTAITVVPAPGALGVLGVAGLLAARRSRRS